MELKTLNKEYKLLREEACDKFVKLSMVDSKINIVEEYAHSYFDDYEMAVEYAKSRADVRIDSNKDGQKPFIILVNGKAIDAYGQLEAFLNGEFKITAVNVIESNVKKLYS